MTDTEHLEDAIHDFATWALSFSSTIALRLPGSRVVWERQTAPRPAFPYVGLSFLTGFARSMARDALSVPDAGSPSDESTLGGEREFTVTVQAFGHESHELMMLIQAALNRSGSREFFWKKQIVAFTVATAAAGTYTFTVSGIPTTITALAGQTVTQIRDALLVAAAANTWLSTNGYVVAAEGSSQFTVAGPMRYVWTYSSSARITSAKTQTAVDLSYIEDYGILDATIRREVGFEKSYLLDIRFNTSVNVVEPLTWIERVDYTDKSITPEQTVTVQKGVEP